MKLSHSLRQRMWGVAVLVAAMTASAPALAQKVLVLGDTSVTTHAVNSSDYWNAAIKEMKAAVDQPLPAPSNVTSIGAINTTDLLPTQLRQPNGDPYDVIVVTAVFGGVTANNRTLLQQAIQNRSAGAFFLFPDQCSSCAANVADITIPFVNAATGWGVTGGTNKTGAETVNLNTNSVAQASFSSFPTLAVNDYTDINNVPVNNALYMRLGAPIPPANPNINDLSFRTDHAAAVIVPRSQSYNGNGACIFVISDVNTLVNGTSPTGYVNVGLGKVLVDAAAGSCSVDEGSIQINKTLTLPSSVSGPLDFKFEATCDKPSAGTVYTSPTMSYPSMTQVTIPFIPAGAQCTVKEILPTAPANYTWVTPAEQTVPTIVKDTGQAITFANALHAAAGVIQITKQLTLPASVPGPITLEFSASCDVNGTVTSYGPVTLDYPTQTSVNLGTPGDAQCRVTETLPPHPAGYSWAAVAPVDVTVPANGTAPVSFTNTLIPVPVATLRITHSLNAPASFTGSAAITVTAICDQPNAGNVHGPFTINAPANSEVNIPNIPVGASCTVSQQLPANPSGFSWGVPHITPTTITLNTASGSAVGISNQLIADTKPVVTAPTPVPLGGLVWLLGSALSLAGLGAVRIRRQRNAMV